MALPPKESGNEFRPTDHELIGLHLAPRAGLCYPFDPGYVEEGVDVFSVRPRALPFWPVHCRRQDGAVWGFFFAERPAAGDVSPGPGGCWVRYGTERQFEIVDEDSGEAEVIAFRRSFRYRFTWKGGAVWAPTRWRMREYRLNTDAAAFRAAHPEAPDPEAAGVVFVLYKVFRNRKPVLPSLPPQPTPAIVDEELEELVLQLRVLTEGE